MAKVGRYKQAQVYVREFDDVTIVLLNQETIYAMPKTGTPNIIYHRFFGERGTYPNWKKFRTSMRYDKTLTRRRVHSIAMRNHIDSFGTQRQPNLQGKRKKYEDLRKEAKCA